MAKFEELNIQYSMFTTQLLLKKLILVVSCWLWVIGSFAQTVTQQLQKAFSAFEKDLQLKHAISSLYVIDANTGKVVFDKNSQIGLAPASTQKVITSVTAFELLGKDYKYKTEFGNRKDAVNTLYINPTGDPTFCSWRWNWTSEDSIVNKLFRKLDEFNVTSIRNVVIDTTGWEYESIPDGWIWQDIGNYYGAGAHKFNFRENQYDISLRSGKIVGDPVGIVSTQIGNKKWLDSKLTSEKKGSGDNAYVYLPDSPGEKYVIRGTIPVNEGNFSISASITDPEWKFFDRIGYRLQEEKKFDIGHGSLSLIGNSLLKDGNYNVIYTHYSPTLDSIIYWFNKKSVNLYGEALIKTFAYEKNGLGSTDSGVAIVKKFWKEKGMNENELNIVDGSGLSPLNRVTTHAQVDILKYAKRKDWFFAFFNSLPEYNGMKIKSGTIRGVKGFCGYHKAKNGKEYIFSFLVNNYNGSAGAVVNKMYKLLDILK